MGRCRWGCRGVSRCRWGCRRGEEEEDWSSKRRAILHVTVGVGVRVGVDVRVGVNVTIPDNVGVLVCVGVSVGVVVDDRGHGGGR